MTSPHFSQRDFNGDFFRTLGYSSFTSSLPTPDFPLGGALVLQFVERSEEADPKTVRMDRFSVDILRSQILAIDASSC